MKIEPTQTKSALAENALHKVIKYLYRTQTYLLTYRKFILDIYFKHHRKDNNDLRTVYYRF